jgi:hypothetical protein
MSGIDLSFVDALSVFFWPFSADHGHKACWSNPMQSVVRTNANDWSGRMQTGGQVECNFAPYVKVSFVTVSGHHALQLIHLVLPRRGGQGMSTFMIDTKLSK